MKRTVNQAACMASGVLVGRLACGVAALSRAIAEPDPWTAAFTVSTTARPMLNAFRMLESSLRVRSPKLRALAQLVEPLKDASGSSLDRSQLEDVHQRLFAGLVDLGKITLEACGKRRPDDEDGNALLRTRKAPRKEGS